MKRIFVPLLLLLLLPIHTPAQRSLPFEGQCSFYCAEACDDARCSVVKNGNGFVIRCDSYCADEVFSQLKGVLGESVCFEGCERDFSKIVNSLGKAWFYEAEGVLVAEGYCPALKGGKLKEGKPVNFQAALDNGVITVGTPLIFGGF